MATYDDINSAAVVSISAEGEQPCLDTSSTHGVLEMCAKVLGRPVRKLRMNKSFVAQGGDSLLAISLMARCNAIGLDLSIRNILQCDTLLALYNSAELQDGFTQPGIKHDTSCGVPTNDNMNKLSSPVVQLQQYYQVSGSRHMKVLRLNNEIPESHVFEILRLALTHLAISHISRPGKSTQWQDIFAYGIQELELDMDHEPPTVQHVIGITGNSHRNQDITVTAFTENGTSHVRFIGLLASRAVVNAAYWEIILDRLVDAFSNCGTQYQQLQSDHGKPAQPMILAPQTPVSYNAGLSNELLCCHTHVDKGISHMLFDELTHDALRTEPSDFILAAIFNVLESNDEMKQADAIFRHIVGSNSTCNSEDSFDLPRNAETVLHFAMQYGSGNTGALNLLRLFKDYRRGSAQSEHCAAVCAHTIKGETAGVNVVLDTTFLTPRSCLHDNVVEEIAQRHLREKSIVEAFPGRLQLYIDFYWDDSQLSFNLGLTENYERRHELASDFVSNLAKLLSIARASTEHVTLSDFPSFKTSYEALDNLITNQLCQITTHPLQDIEDIFPCSRTQEVFLISQKTMPDMYQSGVTAEITLSIPGKPLDYTSLCMAWNRVVKRHGSLRTVFFESIPRPGHFDQVVLRDGVLPLSYYSDGSHAERMISDFLTHQNTIVGDARPTHQAMICRISEEKALIRLDVSHAVIDGQSFRVIFRDLATAYSGAEFEHAAMPYQSFVAHQAALSQEYSSRYWTNYLQGAQPTLIPVENNTSGFHDLDTLQFKVNLDTEKIESLSSKYDITVANLCQVAWAIVLSSYTGLDDVCFSYVNSGRQAPLTGIEHAVGAFIDTMICRVKLTETISVPELLSKAKNDLIDGLSFPGCLTLEYEVDSRRASSFRGNTIMTFQMGVNGQAISGSPLVFKILHEVNPSEYDIALNIHPCHSGVEVQLSYWASRIGTSLAESVSEGFQKAMSCIVQENRPLQEIDVVPMRQIEEILNRNANYPAKVDALIQHSVERHSRLTPDAPALQSWDGEFTYQELNREANKLAAHLQVSGVEPGNRVCMCFEKSKWVAVAQLAILKAGAAIISLNGRHPMRKRMATIIEDTRAHFILTTEKYEEWFKNQVPNVLIVNEFSMARLTNVLPEASTQSSDSLAFIIYTSGSTGTPKGVMLTHSNVCTTLQASTTGFHMGPDTRMIQFSAFTFDAAIHDIFATWHVGGCVCIMSEEDRMSNLAASLCHYNVNYAFLTPTVADTISPAEVPSLKVLALIGEAVKPPIVRRWIDHAAVFNGYGPSECTIVSSFNLLQSGCNPSNVGKACSGAYWLVHPTNTDRLQPVGAIGELLIEGPHVSPGYLNDEEKTCSAFIHDPAWVSAYQMAGNKRLYRTGDLFRQLPDGSLNYIGRRDTQLKIRGQRVEVTEIEHHLINHDAVVDAAIVLPTQGPGEGKLVGLISLEAFTSSRRPPQKLNLVDGAQIPHARTLLILLSDWLSERVPQYMIPTAWVPLSTVLLQNDSGKLDRVKIQQWVNDIDSRSFAECTSLFEYAIQPLHTTQLQLKIQKLWAEVLALPTHIISIDRRSFLSLGGDSITAMKAVARARAEGISMLVTDVLQSKSIVELSCKASSDASPVINDKDMDKPFALSPGQRWYLESSSYSSSSQPNLKGGSDLCNNRRLCLAPSQPLDPQRVAEALKAVVTKHDMLRARFSFDNTNGWYQQIDRTNDFELQIEYARNICEAESISETAGWRINLETGPVFSAQLVHFEDTDGDDAQLLFMLAHQIIIDDRSWQIIAEDLDKLLIKDIPLAPCSSPSFRAWVQSIDAASTKASDRHTMSGDFHQISNQIVNNVGYWELSDTESLHGSCTVESVLLNSSLTSALLDKANSALRTEPEEVVIAALALSFARIFPDRSVPTFFEKRDGRLFNNLDCDASRSVGCFTSISSVQAPASDTDDITSILKRAKDSRRALHRGRIPCGNPGFTTASQEACGKICQDVEVLFNYSTDISQWKQKAVLSSFQVVTEGRDSSIGRRIKRGSIFSIDASIFSDGLQVTFEFPHHMKGIECARLWPKTFLETIQTSIGILIATPCLFSLSDFPLVSSSYDRLQALQVQILPNIGIQPENVEDIYPCTPIQEGILMSQARSPSMYHTQLLWQLQSPDAERAVSVARIAQAYQSLTSRHPMLRAVFIPSISDIRGDSFNQVILRSVQAMVTNHEMDCIDPYATAMSGPLAGFQQHIPNHRLALISTTPGTVYAHFTINHALTDGSSLAVFAKELTNAYNETLPINIEAPSYGSYVSYLQSSETKRALNYWKRKLYKVDACFLPSTSANGSCRTSKSLSSRHVVRASIDGKAFREYSERSSITTANIFQLAWALVLSKFVGSSDVLFGYIASGRDVPVQGVQEMFGPLLNIIVSRVKLDYTNTAQMALNSIQKNFFDSFDMQRTPLVDIWHALGVGSRGLFNTYLSYRQLGSDEAYGRSLVKDLISVQGTSEYDAGVDIVLSSHNCISVSLDYSEEFMDHGAASGLVDCLLQTLSSLIKDDSLPLRELRILPERDVQKLQLWNCDAHKVDEQQCIHHVFHSRCIENPDAIAVDAWDGVLTYSKLEELSKKMAHHLVNVVGVKRETKVAFCFDKSCCAIIAQLAILEAGGAIVPISPKDPTSRVLGILKDIDASIVLTTSRYSNRFDNAVLNVIRLDSTSAEMFAKPDMPVLQTTATPDTTAVIIYTSGSTGIPKGVVLAHRSLACSLQAQGLTFGLNSRTRTIQFVSYTFDVSLTDIWGTLCHGGCLCVPSENERMNDLQGAVETYQANFALLTPTVATLLDLRRLPSLEILVLAGEPLTPAAVAGHLLAGHVMIFNGYGPSECSILTTVFGPLKSAQQATTIGRSLLGSVWLIDETENVCPIGAVGEIWVEGPLLAQGYLNDTEQTMKSFINDPPWARTVGLQGKRFYRTGDMARLSSAGDLVYVGRRDTQVKIRGQRVELDEIEFAVKNRMTGVQQVVASLVVNSDGDNNGPMIGVALELDKSLLDSNGGKSTTGFFTIAEGMKKSLLQLRTSLLEVLPHHMLPVLYIPVARLPMTTSGKIDRRTLQNSIQSLSRKEILHYSLSDVVKTLPETAAEKELQAQWASVLQCDASQLGKEDNFFHSGGDSYLAMRLVSMIQASNTKTKLTVADVFRSPKLCDMARAGQEHVAVAQQPEYRHTQFALWRKYENCKESDAAYLDRSEDLKRVASECHLSVEEIEDIYPCTPLQEGLMISTAQQPRAYVAQWVYKLHHFVDLGQFMAAWQKLAEVAPILRTRIIPGWEMGALQVVVRENLAWSSSHDLDQYLQYDMELSMSYAKPLIRLAIIEPPNSCRYFVWSAHHSIYDGWSLSKMLGAISSIYYSGITPSPLKPFCHLVQYIKQQDTAAAERFWRSQLAADLGERYPLARRLTHQPQATRTLTVHFELKPLRFSLTAASFLRAAWALSVSPHTSGKVFFATPLSGRNAPINGILDMMGPTITTVPIHIEINKTQSVEEYLTAVHQQAIDMFPFEHTGLQYIARLVGRSLDPGHLFAVHSSQGREEASSEDLMSLEQQHNPTMGFDGYPLNVECVTGLGKGTLVEVQARFDKNVISATEVQRLLDRFTSISRQLDQSGVNYGNGTTRKLVGDVQLLSSNEMAQLAALTNRVSEHESCLIQDLIAPHAITFPERPAICSWDGMLSYRQLIQYSECLANRLKELGVGPEVVVLHYFDKSMWAVVAMLAVLISGGVVVPVKADPVTRLKTIIADTAASIMLTAPHLQARIMGMVDLVVCVDNDYLSKCSARRDTVHKELYPHNAAFVMYTSGSTGRPKGVVLEHGSLSIVLQAKAKEFDVNEHTRSLQFSAFTFDMALHDIFTPLAKGGCVCIPSEEARLNNLASTIRQLRVNYMMLTPRVLDTLQASDCPNVRTVLVGGETVEAERLSQWLPQATVFHVYGPSECSILTLSAKVTKNRSLCLGNPLAGRVWVTNAKDYNCLCPIGVVGELLIEGPLLARGYLNDAKKTASAFIENPDWSAKFQLNSSADRRRMYRTGDLVVQREDGYLEFIGRADNQVKVRGQRVELSEIEHHLLVQTEVDDAVVLYARQGRLKNRLAALLTINGVASATLHSEVQLSSPDLLCKATKLRKKISERLSKSVPEYMVPTTWVSLACMPQTTHGKVDRAKLLGWIEALDAETFDYITSDTGTTETPASVRSQTEEHLGEVLADVLNVAQQRIVFSRSFLSLGGDSITAMQVVSHCRTRFGISFHVRDILSSKSISELALRVVIQGVNKESTSSTNGTFALSPIQQLFFQSFAAQGLSSGDELRFNQSVCLTARRWVDKDDIAAASYKIMSAHPMLRARFCQSNNMVQQRIEPESSESFELKYHVVKTHEEMENVIASAQRSLDIEHGPVFSVRCIEATYNQSQSLFLVAHHLVVDIVSWQIIIRDFCLLLQHKGCSVPNEVTSFQHWSQLQADRAQRYSPKDVLPILPPVPDWGYWGVSAEKNVYGNRINKQFVISNCANILFGKHQPLRSEPVEVLLAALFHSFYNEFPERLLPTIFNEGHGREPWDESIDLSNTIGWFTTMTPLHVPVYSNDVIDILKRTKDERQSIRERGFAYFSSRFLTSDGREAFIRHNKAEVMFNFSGRRQQALGSQTLFDINDTFNQPRFSPIGNHVKRVALFEFETTVQQNDLIVTLGLPKDVRHLKQVERWFERYQRSLRDLMHRLSVSATEFTLADFPLLNISYRDLDQLQTKLLPLAGIEALDSVEDIYPCSAAQQSILMAQLKDPSKFQVLSQCEFRTNDSSIVDIEALQRAWRIIVSRHAILRTICIPVEHKAGIFYQVVLKEPQPLMYIVKCKTAEEVTQTFEGNERRSFRKGEPEHVLTVCTTDSGQTYAEILINHSLVDVSSLNLILHEIVLAYEGKLVALPAPSFRDYMTFLQGSSAIESLSFWTSKLKGARPGLLPSLDDSASDPHTLKDLNLTIGDLKPLRDFRDSCGVTVANVLQLAWALVLANYTGSNDILFGYVTNGRDAPVAGVNNMAGPMINMTVSRICFYNQNASVFQVLKMVQNDFMEMFKHQRTSLLDIERATGLREHHMTQSVMSIVREPSTLAASTGTLSIHNRSVSSLAAYALSVNAVCGDSTIELSLQYSSSILNEESAKRLLQSFCNAIFLLVTNSNMPLHDLKATNLI